MISEKAIYSILIILFVGFLYNRWEEKNKDKEQVNGYELVQKYFIGDKKSLGKIKKPFLWIHVSYDWNARKWESFYSRNTLNLNQDYLYLTLRTIIDKYGEDFHICLINDNSFEKLLPYMPMNLAFSSDPLRERLRNLGLAQLLYNFGGITIPISFIANKSIKVIPWKSQDKSKNEGKEIILQKNKIIEDCAIVDHAKNFDCFDLARTKRNFQIRVYGIKLAIQDAAQKQTLIISGVVDDILLDCINNNYLSKDIHISMFLRNKKLIFQTNHAKILNVINMFIF